jgi:cysteine synthase A
MPDDVALEKVQALEALGADVIRVRPASIVDKKQFVVRPFTPVLALLI